MTATIAVWAGVGIQLLIAVFFYGRLTQSVTNLSTQVEKHDATIEDHGERISYLEGERSRAASAGRSN